ncbi:hypothetical protein BCR32DRAFT_287340 [Anaeromyces robustus]|uniref:MULE transposase domain-containing protein n=1 Tax=Anaeromyces robustus TaxID=1754192 RepID=A0A1Y1VS24_9FUNG|nr:hypothetical protein BCR32DRAFT_287340 [Anaeromyces robustus]|eukprot:ORX64102.1 hypothetical protein BCR32DRAFT_287340 [Anaeromyces robustus]
MTKDKSKIYRCTEYKTLDYCKSLIIYESLHNHLEKEIDVSISVIKHKIKEEIRKNSILLDIKPKHIYNVSQEMGLICPEYNLIIFQSPFQAYLFSNYHENIFADSTFYVAPKFSYQLFITRTYVEKFNQATYEALFEEIKKNANKFRSNTLITPINLHCDFEQGISNALFRTYRL